MKRQNSIPQPLRPSTTLNINQQRKCSHDSLKYNDANPVLIPGSLTPITQQHNCNKNNENEALNPILVTDLGNSISHSLKVYLFYKRRNVKIIFHFKRVTLTEETIPSPESLSPASSMHTITFGFASAATAHFRKISADCEFCASTSRPTDNNESK